MKQFNGFETAQEQEFITNIVSDIAFANNKVHTVGVYLENGTIQVVINDVLVEFDDFDKVKILYTDWKPTLENVLKKRIGQVLNREFAA